MDPELDESTIANEIIENELSLRTETTDTANDVDLSILPLEESSVSETRKVNCY